MPTEEQLNAAQVELDIANDNYARLADKYNKYNAIFEAYKNSSPEKQEAAKGVMQEALVEYNQLKNDMRATEDRIAVAQNTVNAVNEAIAAQQAAIAAQQTAARRRSNDREINYEEVEEWKPIYNDKGEIVGQQRVTTLKPRFSRPGSFTGRKAVKTPTVEEAWEDIYNSGGRNEYKKGFNNALVDDLVLPVASALGASDDTIGVLSELKMPATEREMASKYYAYGGWGKDAADAALQYLGLKGAGEILGLTTKASTPAYTVANSGRGIYNTPYAWRAVNRAGSNYSPAYWGNGVKNLRAAGLSNLIK